MEIVEAWPTKYAATDLNAKGNESRSRPSSSVTRVFGESTSSVDRLDRLARRRYFGAVRPAHDVRDALVNAQVVLDLSPEGLAVQILKRGPRGKGRRLASSEVGTAGIEERADLPLRCQRLDVPEHRKLRHDDSASESPKLPMEPHRHLGGGSRSDVPDGHVEQAFLEHEVDDDVGVVRTR